MHITTTASYLKLLEGTSGSLIHLVAVAGALPVVACQPKVIDNFYQAGLIP